MDLLHFKESGEPEPYWHKLRWCSFTHLCRGQRDVPLCLREAQVENAPPYRLLFFLWENIASGLVVWSLKTTLAPLLKPSASGARTTEPKLPFYGLDYGRQHQSSQLMEQRDTSHTLLSYFNLHLCYIFPFMSRQFSCFHLLILNQLLLQRNSPFNTPLSRHEATLIVSNITLP